VNFSTSESAGLSFSHDWKPECLPALAQTDLDSAHVGGNFKTDITTAQIENHPSPVLKPDARSAAGNRYRGTYGRIGARGVARLSQVVCGSDEISLRCSDRRAKTQARGCSRISTAVEDRGSTTTSDTDD
jgi:hypothetical protein